MALPVTAQQSPTVCGAVTADQTGPDGLNTAVIQAKLDSCFSINGGQLSVELSSANGANFTSGALFIPNNVVLRIGAGVILHASTNPAGFQRTVDSPTQACNSSGPIPVCGTLDPGNTGCLALINACQASRIGVTGPGTIEGHGWSALSAGPNAGKSWWALAGEAKAGNYATSLNAPKIISFQQSTNVTVADVTIRNAPMAHVLFQKVANAAVTGVTIVTPTPDHAQAPFPYNSDGLDFSGSSNIQVDRADISAGDDNIAFQGGGNGPVNNVSVTNSILRAGHGLSIGSPTSRGVTNLTANNIRFIGTDNGIRIKSDTSNGGVVDQVRYTNVCMAGVKNAIVIDPYYSSSTGSLVPQFKTVEIAGMWADSGNVVLKAHASQPPVSVTLNNVRIDRPGSISVANANIAQISDPTFPFPLPIPQTPGVTLTQAQATANPPADIKSYCQAALGLGASTPVDQLSIEDTFADANSQNQDLAHQSLRLFNGRTNNVRTDQPGSVTFDMTPAGSSSEAVWAYFTPAGSSVSLGIGDSLTVGVTFSLSGFQANGQDVRFGVLDSLGTRNTSNLTGGMNDGTFAGDTGYGLDFYASGAGSPFVIGRRTTLSSANVFNSFGDFSTIPGTGASARQALADGTSYTLTYRIERLSATGTRISASVIGSGLENLSYSAVESSPAPNTTFDYFAFRVGGTNFATRMTFTKLTVRYSPGPPVITSQPQPSNVTLQVGGSVTLAVGASGSQLSYQWQQDGKPIVDNPSALTPSLTLQTVRHADAGSYVAVVSNAGGSVTSNAVTVAVSDLPVPPPPSISMQPADTTVPVGGSAALSVAAGGNGLVYQWFKNGVIIPGATSMAISFPNAQTTDSGSYSVVVSNSSGSIASSAATLTVVSAMSPVGFRPWNHQTGICGDTPLYVAFDRQPRVGKYGRIRIHDSRGAVVDTIDMAASPQTRMFGNSAFSYYPVIVTGNIAAIYPHQQLPYGGTYSVTIEPGVLADDAGAPFAGFTSIDFWRFTTRTAAPAPGAAGVSVGFDDSDFCTVQGAVDFVPANNSQPVVITVKPGVFTGIVYVPSNKPFITVRGEDRNASVIQYPNNAAFGGGNRALFGVDAPDFTLENITLRNTTPRGGSQAEAFRGNNQRILLNRVNLTSYQDTLWLQGTGLVTDSYIEGDVDFMWGYGAVFFRNSELKALSPGGYYTQIRNGQGQNGNVYVNCRLTAAPGVTGSYLSRIDPSVFPYSQVVYINSVMGPHISPVGWLLNNSNVGPNVQFWEYGSVDPNGAPVDVSQRLNVSRQLLAGEAAQWSDPAYVLGGWVPYTVNATASGSGIEVSWSAAPGHSPGDSIGLFAVDAAGPAPLASSTTGGATTGRLTFAAPEGSGTYEFRYLAAGGGAPKAVSNRVTVAR